MTERKERAKAIAAMIETDIQSAAGRLQPGETLQLHLSYDLFLQLQIHTDKITGEHGAPMYFGDARAMVLIDNAVPTGELSYTVLIVTKHRKLEGV